MDVERSENPHLGGRRIKLERSEVVDELNNMEQVVSGEVGMANLPKAGRTCERCRAPTSKSLYPKQEDPAQVYGTTESFDSRQCVDRKPSGAEEATY